MELGQTVIHTAYGNILDVLANETNASPEVQIKMVEQSAKMTDILLGLINNHLEKEGK